MSMYPKYKKEDFEKAIKGCRGIKSVAYKRMGTNNKTFDRYLEKYPELMEQLVEEREQTHDWVESKILKKIDEGDTTMIIFFAKTQMRKRGYTQDINMKHSGDEEHPIKTVIDLSKLTADDIKKLAKEL